MSTENDGCYHDKGKKDDHAWKYICLIIIFALITTPSMILIAIFYLTPYPTFTLHDVKLTTFNFSTTTSALTSNLQITISCRHKADSFHFEKIDVYASYGNQQITLPTMLPPMYLVDFTVWSLSLNGTEVPVTPDLAAYLVQDVTVGNVLINVEVRGLLRSKSGFLSRRFRLNVNCPEYIMFGNNSDVIGSATKLPFVEGCHVGVTPLETIMQILTSAIYNFVGV